MRILSYYNMKRNRFFTNYNVNAVSIFPFDFYTEFFPIQYIITVPITLL